MEDLKVHSIEVTDSNPEYTPQLPVGLRLQLDPRVNLILGTNNRGKSIFCSAFYDAVARRWGEITPWEEQRRNKRNLSLPVEREHITEKVRNGIGIGMKVEGVFQTTDEVPPSSFFAIPKPPMAMVTAEGLRDRFKGEIKTVAYGIWEPYKILRKPGEEFSAALAAVSNLRIVIADEPTSRWGLAKGLMLLQHLLESAAVHDQQLLIVEHNPVAVAQIATHFGQEVGRVFYFKKDAIEEGPLGDVSIDQWIDDDPELGQEMREKIHTNLVAALQRVQWLIR